MSALPVRRIELPTPYAVGPVNVYLIESEPLTMIDAGINTLEAQNALFLGLAAVGYFPQSIERILVTHAHPDHYGLVHVVQELSGATVYFPAREIARVRDAQMMFEIGRLLVEAGMPLDLLFQMDQQRKDQPRPKVDHDTVVSMADGDSFSFDDNGDTWSLQARLLPGHTGGHMVFFEPTTGTLFSGDQLLPKTSPNPLLEPSLDEPGERRRSLKEYLASLQEMRVMAPALVYPGHGDPVQEPLALIDRTIEHHAQRKKKVAAVLGSEGKSPYEIARELFPRVRGYDIFLSVSEIVAHLDLVVEDGDALMDYADGVTVYRACRPPGR